MYRLIGLVVCSLYSITQIKGNSVDEFRNLVYFKEPKTWLQAKKACSECGGRIIDWDDRVSYIVSKNNLQNTITWIGNYTSDVQWIMEKGCTTESTLKDKPYNVIYHNNPELCSRTCRTDQMFIIKEDLCYCMEASDEITPCNKMIDRNGTIKVYSISYVFTCDFENDSCTNTSVGEETVGLTWRRTMDYEISNIGVNKGHYLHLENLNATVKNKARFQIRLNLTETYFCMLFKYFMNHDGLLEISLSYSNLRSHTVWNRYGNKGKMWFSSSLDIKGHSNLEIEIFGSIETNNLISNTSTVAIDDIKIMSGSCNKEKRLDCRFDDGCEWEQGSAWQINSNSAHGYTNGIGQITEDLLIGIYYLETIGKDNLYELNGFGINRHIATTYCLQFVMFKGTLNNLLYVKQNETQLFVGNKISAKKWIKQIINIKAKYPYFVKFMGSTKNGYIRIGNISLRSGSCRQDTIMHVENFDHWHGNGILSVTSCGVNCFDFELNGSKYNLISPLIEITFTTLFCLTLHSWVSDIRYIRIATLVNGAYNFLPANLMKYSGNWIQYGFDFKATDDFKIVFEVSGDNSQYSFFTIKWLKLISGVCKKGTNDASMGPMCPVIDLSDSSRLSVGYCSKMKEQPYICHLRDNHFKNSFCKNGKQISLNNTELRTTQATTSLETDEISSLYSEIPYKNTTIVDPKSTNIPSLLNESESTRLETGLAVVTSVLSVIVLFLVFLTICLCLKIKRKQSVDKDKANLGREIFSHNRGYEMEETGTTHIQTTANDTDYELACPVKVQQNQRRINNSYSNDNTHTKLDSGYQNCDNLDLRQKRESQVYQDMKEGDYDHLGESAKRRKDFEFESDTLYDHGQKQKLHISSLYDSTKNETDDSYFVLEPETDDTGESHIYDHTN